MRSISDADHLAASLLERDLPLRLRHVRGTGNRVTALSYLMEPHRSLLAVAGTLHDIGYAHELIDVGFHPIDGARFLRDDGWEETVVNLVAHHSCAVVEAERRGLLKELNGQFPRDDSLPHDELCFCDMTTGPAGQLMTIDERLADIRTRYDLGSIVGDAIDEAEQELRAAVQRVQVRIESA